MTPNPDAVKAAAEALFARIFYAAPGWEEGNADEHALATGYAEAAVAAAEPILRRQIAAEIRALADSVRANPSGVIDLDRYFESAYRYAARIAEGTP